MKKLLALLVAFFTLAGYASATNIADDFRAHYSASSDLSAYNKDINAMIGVADFHTGKGTTFPGFDIGATLSAVKPSDKKILLLTITCMSVLLPPKPKFQCWIWG